MGTERPQTQLTSTQPSHRLHGEPHIKQTNEEDGYDCSGHGLLSIPDDLPNSTKTLDFSFNHLPAIYNTTFVRLKDLILLDLTRCNINWIFENVLDHQTDLETLILIGNQLQFVADYAFAGPQSLKHISLIQTSLTDMKFLPRMNLNSIETLDLGDNDIDSLLDLNLFNWQTIRTLNLAMNSIQNLSAADMGILKTSSLLDISFKGNNIVFIEPKAFESCQFNSLDFSDCFSKGDISVILDGLTGVLTNILSLRAYEDSPSAIIRAESLHAFCNITVKELRFQLQHFHDLTDDTPFECLKGLQKLDLTRSHLNSLPASIAKMTSLTHLILNENSFKDLCQTNAASLSKLTVLSVRGNQLKPGMDFKESCLRNATKLKHLDLSQSRLLTGGVQCCEVQLAGLGQLRKLNISYNFPASSMKWADLPFNATSKLTQLDCSNLKVTRIPQAAAEGPLRNLGQLQLLNISWDFSTLSTQDNLLEGLKSLEQLNLKDSSFKDNVVSNREIFMHTPLLQSLVLAKCSIVAVENNVFSYLTNLKDVDLSGNKLVVVNMKAFHSLNIVLLNFARNLIEIVDIHTVKSFGEKSRIDISDNPLACNCSNIQLIGWIQSNANKVINIDMTKCIGFNERLSNVHLKCGVSTGMLAFALVVMSMTIIAIAFFIKKKLKYCGYQQIDLNVVPCRWLNE
ncbi:CD180 antigen [Esox lucius]|uniref:CD180 antigen n=1 Tax=Esox lucius TaxID=8010 RepID=UPI001476D9FB|nr:CD180 antigen [Esox lucius]